MLHRTSTLGLALVLFGCDPAGGGTGETTTTTSTSTSSPSTSAGPGSADGSGTTGTTTTTPTTTTTTTAGSTTTGPTAESSTGSTGTTTDSGGPTEDSSGSESTGVALCEMDDMYEPNNDPGSPTEVVWDSTTAFDAQVVLNGFLCSEQSDWYRLEVSDLTFEFYGLHLDVIVAGSSWCGEPCMTPFLPDAPENAIGVEVYDAMTMMLLNDQVVQNGRINIGGSGEPYSNDLLIHVYGPTPAATYDYDLYAQIRGYDGEDECEC